MKSNTYHASDLADAARIMGGPLRGTAAAVNIHEAEHSLNSGRPIEFYDRRGQVAVTRKLVKLPANSPYAGKDSGFKYQVIENIIDPKAAVYATIKKPDQ